MSILCLKKSLGVSLMSINFSIDILIPLGGTLGEGTVIRCDLAIIEFPGDARPFAFEGHDLLDQVLIMVMPDDGDAG